MKLIVGLGNKGPEYKNTRHNLGFMALDHFQSKFHLEPFRYDRKFFGDITTGQINGEKVILLQPQTYMNLSGKSIQAVAHYYRLKPSDILIIFDDIDTPFGNVKFKAKGGSGGHNGIKSIISALGTQEFARVKGGVSNDLRAKAPTSAFVLGKFTNEELSTMPEVYNDIESKVFDWMK